MLTGLPAWGMPLGAHGPWGHSQPRAHIPTPGRAQAVCCRAPPVPPLLGRTQGHLCTACPPQSSSPPAHPQCCQGALSGTPPTPCPPTSLTRHCCRARWHPCIPTPLSTQPCTHHCPWGPACSGGCPRSQPGTPQCLARCSRHATREHPPSGSFILREQHEGAGGRERTRAAQGTHERLPGTGSLPARGTCGLCSGAVQCPASAHCAARALQHSCLCAAPPTACPMPTARGLPACPAPSALPGHCPQPAAMLPANTAPGMLPTHCTEHCQGTAPCAAFTLPARCPEHAARALPHALPACCLHTACMLPRTRWQVTAPRTGSQLSPRCLCPHCPASALPHTAGPCRQGTARALPAPCTQQGCCLHTRHCTHCQRAVLCTLPTCSLGIAAHSARTHPTEQMGSALPACLLPGRSARGMPPACCLHMQCTEHAATAPRRRQPQHAASARCTALSSLPAHGPTGTASTRTAPSMLAVPGSGNMARAAARMHCDHRAHADNAEGTAGALPRVQCPRTLSRGHCQPMAPHRPACSVCAPGGHVQCVGTARSKGTQCPPSPCPVYVANRHFPLCATPRAPPITHSTLCPHGNTPPCTSHCPSTHPLCPPQPCAPAGASQPVCPWHPPHPP